MAMVPYGDNRVGHFRRYRPIYGPLSVYGAYNLGRSIYGYWRHGRAMYNHGANMYSRALTYMKKRKREEEKYDDDVSVKRPRREPGRRRFRRLYVHGRRPFFRTAIRRRRANRRYGGYMHIERKFIDRSYGPTAVSNTRAGAEADPAGGILCLGGPAQGNTESTRDGRRIRLLSLYIRGDVYATALPDQADAPSQTHIIRVMVVLDKQSNGAQLASETVITNATHLEHAHLYLENSLRYKILAEKTFVLNPVVIMTDGANTGSVGYQTEQFKWYIPLHIRQTFSSADAGIAGISDNSLHVIAFGNSTTAFLQYESRVRFVG